MRRVGRSSSVVVATLLTAALLTTMSVSASAQSSDAITVDLRADAVAVELGEMVDLAILVTNNSPEPARDLVVHIDITSLDRDGSVDPEDWTPTLSKPIDQLEVGRSATIPWTIQPISPGRFTVYAVVLSPDSTVVPTSNAVMIDVVDRRTLNPQGVLPVALGMPAVVGLLFLDRVRRNRNRTQEAAFS